MPLRKFIPLLLSFVLLAGCQQNSVPSSVVRDAKNELVIYSWEGYLPDSVLDAFTEETGIPWRYSTFESNEEMFIKLSSNGATQYDLVLASDYIISDAVRADLAMPLNKEQIARFTDIDPSFQSHFYDPENTYTVPFAAGSPLIIYDPAKVDVPIRGYEDLWNPALENSLAVFDDARLMVGFTMKTLGGSLNSTDPELIALAGEKLQGLAPNVKALQYNTGGERIVSGEVSVSFVFTPHMLYAIKERPDLKVVYPEEGLGFGIDAFFIPANAPHSDAAHAFLNFILDGAISAELSEYAGYMNCVSTARAYMSEDLLNNEYLYIPVDALEGAEFMQDIPFEATESIEAVWENFKALLAQR